MNGKANVPKLRFPEFRDKGEWVELPLSNFFSHMRNGFVGTATPYYEPNGIPYLQGKNIKEGKVDPTNLVTISKAFHEKQKKSQLHVGDVLMVQSGHVGECAVVDKEFAGGNCHALIVMSPESNASSLFFVYYFYAPQGLDRIASVKTGNTIAHILATDLRCMTVCVPKLEEQQRIADCLASLDERITLEAQKLDTLKTHKKGLMQQLFPAEGETLPKLRFPEFWDAAEWESGTIDSLAVTIMGNAFKSSDFVEEGIQLIRMGNLYQGELQLNRTPVYLPANFSEEYPSFLIKPLDLLMSMTGTAGKNDYGFVVQIPEGSQPFLLNQRVVKINAKQNYVKAFLFQLLKSSELLNILYSLPGGTKQANLSAQQLKDIRVAFPPPEEQQKIADCLTSLDDLITAQTQKLDTLKAHKKGLMQQLFPSLEEAGA